MKRIGIGVAAGLPASSSVRLGSAMSAGGIRARRSVAAVLLAAACAIVLVSGDRPAAAAQASRLAGLDRYATAVAISNEAFPQSAEHVFLTRGDVFADALGAGSVRTGPVLLVPSCGSVPDVVRTEITRLDPSTVYALGENGAVCDTTLTQAAAGRPTARLAGPSRYETAVAVSQFAFPGTAPAVYLANAEASPDAVAGGVLTQGPILLVPASGTVPNAVKHEIDRLTPSRVVALGGPSAVSDNILAQAAGSRPTERLAGANRHETAAAISAYQFPSQTQDVFLARSDVFADAVAGGALRTGPILLVPQCGSVPAPVRAEIDRLDPLRVVALGDDGAVCSSLLNSAATGSSGGGGGGNGSIPSELVGTWVQTNDQGNQRARFTYVFKSDSTYTYSSDLCTISTGQCSQGMRESGSAAASGSTLTLNTSGGSARSYEYSVTQDCCGRVLLLKTPGQDYGDAFYYEG